MDKIGMVDGDKLLDWLESKVWSCRDTQEKHGWNDAVWTLNRLVRDGKFKPATPAPTQPSGVGPTWTALILRKDWIEDPDLLGPKGSIRYSNINDAEFYSGGAPGCVACGVVTYGPNDKPHTDNCWLMKIQQALTASPEASQEQLRELQELVSEMFEIFDEDSYGCDCGTNELGTCFFCRGQKVNNEFKDFIKLETAGPTETREGSHE